jgi:hypothetical protein
MYFDVTWKESKITTDGDLVFESACFSGPGIALSRKLQDSDRIRIDLTQQYSSLLSNYYIAVLDWSGVQYKTNVLIELTNCIIRSLNPKIYKTLNRKDKIRVYLENHDESVHHKNLVYKAEVLDIWGNVKDVR